MLKTSLPRQISAWWFPLQENIPLFMYSTAGCFRLNLPLGEVFAQLNKRLIDFSSSFMDNKLRILRKEHNLTQVELQMHTGIEQSLLSKFENGERIPPTETLIALADFYNVSIDYILCRTKNPHINI